MATKANGIEWMCTQCGRKERRPISSGRPMPGTCPKKNGKPHSWVKNRSY